MFDMINGGTSITKKLAKKDKTKNTRALFHVLVHVLYA